MKQYAYNVYLAGEWVDTVFANYVDAEYMRRSLIDHDGYDSHIVVRLVSR